MKTNHLFLSKKINELKNYHLMSISNTIINWYLINKRELPWRETTDPYCIWVSEIIMQQTRVNQGLPYYNRFIQKFPTVFHLANAPETDVLNVWQGLGYYSRARNMHQTAKTIANQFQGIFPRSSAELKKLKGIGTYTAAAISSICFNESIAAIDGNLIRVIARIYNINEPVDKSTTFKMIEQIGNDLIKNVSSALFNQSLMDLGATICTSKNPLCNQCPLMANCNSFAKNTQTLIPYKQGKTVVKNRYFYYLVFIASNKTLINKRIENDIWKGLYDFPLIETDTNLNAEDILTNPALKSITETISIQNIKIFKVSTHKLSHQILHTTFIIVKAYDLPLLSDHVITEVDDINNYPLPNLIDKHLNKLFNREQ